MKHDDVSLFSGVIYKPSIGYVKQGTVFGSILETNSRVVVVVFVGWGQGSVVRWCAGRGLGGCVGLGLQGTVESDEKKTKFFMSVTCVAG